MDSKQLIAEERKLSNKGAIKELRRKGRIPAILYGKEISQPLSIDAKNWLQGFRNVSANTIIRLTVGKVEHKVLVKDTQEVLIRDQINHIDFYAIHADRKLSTSVPIHLEGSPKGIIEGGILEHKLEELEVTCLPKDLPDSITLNIAELAIGESLHVRDIQSIPGVEFRSDSTITVVLVGHPKSGESSVESAEETEEDTETGGSGEEE